MQELKRLSNSSKETAREGKGKSGFSDVRARNDKCLFSAAPFLAQALPLTSRWITQLLARGAAESVALRCRPCP